MRAFEYIRAETPQQAVAAGGAGARFVAGGTNLVDLLKLEVEGPERLVDIRVFLVSTDNRRLSFTARYTR